MRWSYGADISPTLWRSGRQALAEKGFLYILPLAAGWATFPLWRLYFKVFPRGFDFQGRRYIYFLHNYNITWGNERAVEIPIVRAELERARGRRVLEVGNVLAHYGAVEHEVLDKFERGQAIRNEDVATFRAGERYDLIVSISTLEHVGFDEEPRDPDKIRRAIANLRDHLAPGGRLLVTLPLGYNAGMDAQLAAGELPFDRCSYLKREGFCSWREASWGEVAGAAYAERWPGTRGLVIGLIENGEGVENGAR
jgi:SAM-dependent methyltransferase